jgi:hypothetical protein
MVGYQRWVGALLAATFGATLTNVAFADDESSWNDSEEPAEKSERWYGWQTLAADAVPATLLVAGVALDDGTSPSLYGAAALTFVVGGPVIHAVHDHAGKALGSLGLRLALPVVGVVIGSSVAPPLNPCPALPGGECEESDSTPVLLGGVFGMTAASIIDSALLAYEAETPAAERRRLATPSLRATPTFAISETGARVGLVGTF